MVAFLSRQRLNLPVAPLAAGVFALFTALLFALMPTSFLEDIAIDSGIAAVLSAAEPPLGFTARAVLILIGGGGVGGIAWFALFLLLGGRTVSVGGPAVMASGEVPVLRRADAHPDAPPRQPLFANRDLGTPFLDVHAVRRAAGDTTIAKSSPPIVQALPQDLDLPLAAFDPAAIPDDPADWFPPPAPLLHKPRRQVFEPGERLETFALPHTDPPVAAPQAIRQPMPIAPPQAADFDASASIHALLDRLERGVGRREAPVAQPAGPAAPPNATMREESLEEALVSLRRLATRR